VADEPSGKSGAGGVDAAAVTGLGGALSGTLAVLLKQPMG